MKNVLKYLLIIFISCFCFVLPYYAEPNEGTSLNPHTDVDGEESEPTNPNTNTLPGYEYAEYSYYNMNKQRQTDTIDMDINEESLTKVCFDDAKTICFDKSTNKLILNNFKGYNLYFEGMENLKVVLKGDNEIHFLSGKDENASLTFKGFDKNRVSGAGTLTIKNESNGSTINSINYMQKVPLTFAKDVVVDSGSLNTDEDDITENSVTRYLLKYVSSEIVINPKQIEPNPHTDIIDAYGLYSFYNTNKQKQEGSLDLVAGEIIPGEKCFDEAKTICFDKSKNRLTLNNFRGYNLYFEGEENLEIVLKGKNEILFLPKKLEEASLTLGGFDKIKVSGDGTLTIKNESKGSAINSIDFGKKYIPLTFASGVTISKDSLDTENSTMKKNDMTIYVLKYKSSEIIINPSKEAENSKPEEKTQEGPKKICKVIDGKLYIYEGIETNKTEYETTCGLLENPHTGIKISIVSIALLGSVYLFIKIRSKKSSIQKI